jgi:phosphatidylinositol alpha-1,6-mannosyltransferase
MRILALLTDAWGTEGGIAQFNRDLLRAFGAMASQAEVTVVTLYGREPDRALPRLHALCAHGSRVRFVWHAWRALRGQRRWDWIFCGHLNFVVLARALARHADTRMWLMLHGIDAWNRPSIARARAAEHAALVTAVSRYTRGRFLEWAKIAPERVRVLPNTVGERFEPGPPSEALVRRLGVHGKRVLLTLGRLASEERAKGHDRVIESLPTLRQQFPDLVYLIAGDGPDRARLERLARDLQVEDIVVFAGRIAREDIVALHRLAELFVMPSVGEGFGIVFIEAMASGVPALGSDRDGSRDALREGALGHCANIRDLPRAIAAGLSDTVRGTELAARVRASFGRTQFNQHIAALCATARDD